MKLPELRLAYCLLPLIALAQPATAITNSQSLFFIQSVNIAARYYASDFAHQKPVNIVISTNHTKSSNTPRVTARFPIAMQAKPSLMLKKALSQDEPKLSFTLVDLNNDGNKEAIVMTRPGFCGNRTCPVKILKLDNQKKSYNLLSETWTSRDLNLALLPTKSNGWQDLAVTAFSYETKTIDWYAVKFDGETYKSSSQKLAQVPQNIILSEKSPEFDLRDFPSTQFQSVTTDKNISFQVCLERNAWVRPSLSEQKNHLASNGRYSSISAEDNDHWKYKVFALTTYPGSSGTYDIGNVWKVI